MASAKKGSIGIGNFRLYTEKERDNHIGALVAEWENEKREAREKKKPLPFLTISRQYGSMSLEAGLRIEALLNQTVKTSPKWTLYDKEIVKKISEELHVERLNELLTESTRSRIAEYMRAHFLGDPSRDQVFQTTVRIVRSLCEKGRTVVIGRGGCCIASDLSNGFHIRVTAPFEWRVNQISSFFSTPREETEKRIRLIDSEREAFIKNYFNRDISDPDLYDLVLNQERLSMDVMAQIVVSAMKEKGLFREP